ncbi:hypothetical protein Klosneuvirus_1_420 [Klosneuvirus KNV1]|uniref:Uncharacterized protein n=1 Tax=Klosneuvirus KNV1 TaxID=1977640 RepID=A0A1V0SIL9_9VIRU|nr:hypothetical protein Klosneuvirus_1_420 [Klosneuvirus KNV1]
MHNYLQMAVEPQLLVKQKEWEAHCQQKQIQKEQQILDMRLLVVNLLLNLIQTDQQLVEKPMVQIVISLLSKIQLRSMCLV